MSSNTLNIDNSYIYFDDYFQLPLGSTNITNSELKSASEGTRTQLHLSGYLNLKDTKVDVGDVLLSGSGTDFDNVDFHSVKAYTFFPKTIKNSKIVIDNASTLTLSNIENSDVTIENGNVQFWVYGSIINSNITFKPSTQVVFDSEEISNSNVNIEHGTNIIGTITKLENTFFNIEGDSTFLSTLNISEFVNSLFISKNANNSDAFFTPNDLLGTNNLVAYAEDGSLLDYEIDPNKGYRFYKDGEVSTYVEIRSPMNIKAKVVNGTWSDGSSEDKNIETYYGVKLSDIIPTGMIANPGYKAGSWNIEINEDRIFDTIELVYTFVEDTKEDTNEEVEEAKEEDVVNPKTADSLSTIKIIALFASIIGLLGKIIITYKKKIG